MLEKLQFYVSSTTVVGALSAAALAKLLLPAVADRLQVGEVVSTIPSKLYLWDRQSSRRENSWK